MRGETSRERLIIENFGGIINEEEIEFTDITILYGNNDYKKDTVLKLIYYFRKVYHNLIPDMIRDGQHYLYIKKFAYKFFNILFSNEIYSNQSFSLSYISSSGSAMHLFYDWEKRKSTIIMDSFIKDYKNRLSDWFDEREPIYLPSGRSIVSWNNINLKDYYILNRCSCISQNTAQVLKVYGKEYKSMFNKDIWNKISDYALQLLGGKFWIKWYKDKGYQFFVEQNGIFLSLDKLSFAQQEAFYVIFLLTRYPILFKSYYHYPFIIENPENGFSNEKQSLMGEFLNFVYKIIKPNYIISTESDYIIGSIIELVSEKDISIDNISVYEIDDKIYDIDILSIMEQQSKGC